MNHYSNAELIADMRRYSSLSREDNDRLYDAVKAGDAVAHRQMIEGNMFLVVQKVDCFLGRHPYASHLRDDLTSAGFTGLLAAVSAIAEGDVDNTNITGYLAVCIGRELENLMDSENPIYVNGRLRRLARENGYELQIPTVQAWPFDGDKQHDPDECQEPVESDASASHCDLGYDPVAMTELRDTLDACCHTDAERIFMRMREAKYTFQEIADALRLPVGSVYAMKVRLHRRFLRQPE